MATPARIVARFASAKETAKALGVSQSRAKKLIELVDSESSPVKLRKPRKPAIKSRGRVRAKAIKSSR